MEPKQDLVTGDVKERLIAAVRAGRYALLLGAGFATEATSPDGRRLPLSRELADELATSFAMPTGHPLSRLWPALPSPAREDYLVRRFRGCQVAADRLPVNALVWRVIYTFNVDDVLERIYGRPGSTQALEFVTHKTAYSTPESLATLRCVHLHGSVLRAEDGYVFSTSEYAGSTVHYRAWGPALADELAVTPFIVIGCSLDEYDLEHHLARRGEIDAGREPAPSFLVLPTTDPLVEATAKRHGLVVVAASATEFLDWLRREAQPIPTVREILLPRDPRGMFAAEPPERDLRLFSRQFIHVVEGELPQPFRAQNFLRGLEPAWSDIEQNHDVIRADVQDLLDVVRRLLGAPSRQSTVLMLAGAPGSGKSALLLRLALELSRIRVPTFFFRGDERLNPIAAAACLSQLRGQGVLIVDSIGDHADQIAQLAEQVAKTGTRLLLIGADREPGVRRTRIAISEYGPTIKEIKPLSRSEASELVRKMRSEGLLGRSAAQSDDALSSRTQGKDLLVALCEIAGNARRFDDLVRSIWLDLPTDQHRRFLAAIAVAHSFGSPIKFAIAQSISGVPVGALMKEVGSGAMQGIVFRTGYGAEYLQIAHRVVAERLVEAAISEEALFDTYVSLALRIAPYVSRQTIKARTLEARLAARLLDYEPYVRQRLGGKAREFYSQIKARWEWNSRYWEQLALLELREGDAKTAIAHAEQAVSIERHPLTYTTLGKVLMTAAEGTARIQEARIYLDDAVAALKEAIRFRHRFGLRDEHAHHVGILGAIRFFRRWSVKPDHETAAWVDGLLAEAESVFRWGVDWDQLRQQWLDVSARR